MVMVNIRVAEAVPQPLVCVYVIVTVPAATPAMSPVPATMVARAGLLLAHVPPGELEVRVWVAVTDILPAPTMAPAVGSGLTVVTAVRLQPFTHV